MSVRVRWEQCCETPNCIRPAWHGVLCNACFQAASPARRAVEVGASLPEVDAWDIVAAAERMLS